MCIRDSVITCQNDGAKPNDIENILSSKGGILFLTVLINGNGGNIQYLEKDGILTATAVLGRKNEDITTVSYTHLDVYKRQASICRTLAPSWTVGIRSSPCRT